MSKKRVSKGAKLGDYRPTQSQVKTKKPSSQFHGFKIKFENEPILYQQQQESDLYDQQDTPINMLQINTQSLDGIQKADHDIKTVNSQILVPEDIDNDFPVDISGAKRAKSSLKKDGEQSLALEKNWAKQEQFTQSLFIRLLIQNEQPFMQILKNQKQHLYPFQLIHSFFYFRGIMTNIALNYRISRTQQLNSNLQQLKKYISQKIVRLGRQRCEDLNLKYFPEIFLIFITQTHQRYINKLLSSNKIQRALAVANFQDKAFLNFPSRYAKSNFQFQLTCMREKDLDLLKNSVWLLQLGVVTNIFKYKNIYDYGQLIIQRQIQFQNHILPSQFLVFCLQWNKLSKQKRLQNSQLFEIKEEEIQKLIKLVVRAEYYELWQFFVILQAQLPHYPNAFKMVLENLIRKLKKPNSFLQLISLSRINSNQIASYFNLYISQNEKIKANPQLINDLKNCILKGLDQNKTFKIALKLSEWVNLTQLKELYKRRNYEQYLTKLLKQFEKLQKSDFVNLEELLNMTRQAITDFTICCNYKFNKRKYIYKILSELEKKIPQSKKKYLDIIQGCRSFIQLRQGIFQLHKQGKLRSIEYLYDYLQQQAKRFEKSEDQTRIQNVKRVLKIIEGTLMKMLQTNSGKFYLSQICKQIKKQKEDQFLPSEIDTLLASQGTNFSILMKVLGQNKKILNYTRLLLGFS